MNRVALSTAGVLAGLAAATAFLCIRPAAAPAKTPPVQSVQQAVLAAEAADFGARSNRHVVDALRVAASDGDSDDLGWKYVQLRL
jgi:hypothetical protein